MAVLVKNVNNRNIIEFDNGSFDAWCVYLTRNKQMRYAPKDTEYFSRLYLLGFKYGHQKIYDDFVLYYKRTNQHLDVDVLKLITEIAAGYGCDAEEMDIWLSIIYAGMVAEENKANTILRKRIKRLGMHQVLIEKRKPDYAANFSKGKPWRELDALMKERGF